MSEEIKNCSNCSKTITWGKKGDEYYRIEEIKGVMVESWKDVCSTCWELKKNDYKEQLKAKIQEGTTGASKIIKGTAYYDGGGTSHQIPLHICQKCDKWQEDKYHDCKRERERESRKNNQRKFLPERTERANSPIFH